MLSSRPPHSQVSIISSLKKSLFEQIGVTSLLNPDWHIYCAVIFVYLGQPISVRWTVSNNGVGVTAANRWYDRIFWSEDEQLGMWLLLFRLGHEYM